MIIKFNLSYEADPEIAKWMNTTDFRRRWPWGSTATSSTRRSGWDGHAELRGTRGQQQVQPRSRVPQALGDAGPQEGQRDARQVGLAKKDAEGFRLRTDGKDGCGLEIMTLGGQFLQFTQIAEMIREQWKKIGIDLVVQEVERSLALQRTAANEQQLGAWNNDGSEHLFTFPTHVFPFDTIAVVASSGPLYAKWFQSAGTQGKEPPARMKELMAKFKRRLRRARRRSDPARQGCLEDHRRGGLHHRGDRQWAGVQGVRVSRPTWHIPSRQYNSPDGKTPTISRPVTFYWK